MKLFYGFLTLMNLTFAGLGLLSGNYGQGIFSLLIAGLMASCFVSLSKDVA